MSPWIIRHAIGPAILSLVSVAPAGAITPAAVPQTASRMVVQVQAAGEDMSESELIRQIQLGLAVLNLDPGVADGLMGARTREAIRRFQRSNQLPVTGEPSAELHRQINDAIQSPDDEPEAAAAGTDRTIITGPDAPASGRTIITGPDAVPPANAQQADPFALTGTTWRFNDGPQTDFIVTFNGDGTISGPPYAQHWQWQQQGPNVSMVFENPIGAGTTREGEMTSPREMRGEGSSTRGSSWQWTAVRVQ